MDQNGLTGAVDSLLKAFRSLQIFAAVAVFVVASPAAEVLHEVDLVTGTASPHIHISCRGDRAKVCFEQVQYVKGVKYRNRY